MAPSSAAMATADWPSSSASANSAFKRPAAWLLSENARQVETNCTKGAKIRLASMLVAIRAPMLKSWPMMAMAPTAVMPMVLNIDRV